MPRVVKLLAPGERTGPPGDTLLLTFDQRRLQHGFVFGTKGTCVELDFAEPVRLATDDVLLLDDGTQVEVVAEVEPLVEVRMPDAAALARLAWMLGDRHVPAQIFATRLRVRRTPEIEAFLAGTGATTSVIVAPFEPDREAQARDHEHDHDHDHHDDHHH
jgi:urease accessory protein